mmetsp:Transcript_3388/g.6003  ORF Transcript_3388/g.6003 Transcript_3388/m.6003 type:complete len:241 (-) Transcript_3388:3657-4379(-)
MVKQVTQEPRCMRPWPAVTESARMRVATCLYGMNGRHARLHAELVQPSAHARSWRSETQMAATLGLKRSGLAQRGCALESIAYGVRGKSGVLVLAPVTAESRDEIASSRLHLGTGGVFALQRTRMRLLPAIRRAAMSALTELGVPGVNGALAPATVLLHSGCAIATLLCIQTLVASRLAAWKMSTRCVIICLPVCQIRTASCLLGVSGLTAHRSASVFVNASETLRSMQGDMGSPAPQTL